MNGVVSMCLGKVTMDWEVGFWCSLTLEPGLIAIATLLKGCPQSRRACQLFYLITLIANPSLIIHGCFKGTFFFAHFVILPGTCAAFWLTSEISCLTWQAKLGPPFEWGIVKCLSAQFTCRGLWWIGQCEWEVCSTCCVVFLSLRGWQNYYACLPDEYFGSECTRYIMLSWSKPNFSLNSPNRLFCNVWRNCTECLWLSKSHKWPSNISLA